MTGLLRSGGGRRAATPATAPDRQSTCSLSRRRFIRAAAAAGLAGMGLGRLSLGRLRAQEPGVRPKQAKAVQVLNPRGRAPVSLIIDDSTCLVNLAHFCIPQFAEVFPQRYRQPWRELPREIPDDFLRKFNAWCCEHGVKGKYSVIPYPACVGWLDRELPGWSRKEVDESLKLVRTELAAHWDFHPEMVTHTWVINTKTGRPYPERSERFMENWGWSVGRSADELADYMSYALRILRNVGVECEGITTPGGFGNRSRVALSLATLQSCRDVFGAEIPHYFRHLFTDERSVAPRVEYAAGLDGDDPRCVVSIIGCTGDWFGGWDGLSPGSPDKCITPDLQGGRLPEVIARGEPAVIVCHWPGIYFNGQQVGFKIFQQVVKRLHARYDNLIWMKLSELARYWAARELTAIEQQGPVVRFRAPFACPSFTVGLPARANQVPKLTVDGKPVALHEVARLRLLQPATWVREGERLTVCFDLPKGRSQIELT